MCGCSNGNVGVRVVYNRTQQVIENCEYTEEQLQSWNQRLLCVKNNNLGNLQTLNVYLGVIQSALNSPDYLCLFKKNLDIIFNYIQELISNNICNE